MAQNGPGEQLQVQLVAPNAVQIFANRLLQYVPEVLDPMNSIEAMDGEVVFINRSLWEDCPMLMRQTPVSPRIHVTSSADTIRLFNRVNRTETYSSDHLEILNLMELAYQLEHHIAVDKCLLLLMRSDNGTCFVNEPLPEGCMENTAWTYIRVLYGSPVRQASVYASQLQKLSDHCNANSATMVKARTLLGAMVAPLSQRGIEFLPISFEHHLIPAAILTHPVRGPATYVYVEQQWQPVALFGNIVSPHVMKKIRSFYICYGKYILYLESSSSKIMLRPLDAQLAAVVVERKAVELFARENHVFALCENITRRKIRYWHQFEFKEIYSGMFDGNFMDFNVKKRLLCLSQDEAVFTLLKVKNCNASLIARVDASLIACLNACGMLRSLYFKSDKLHVWTNVGNSYICTAYDVNGDNRVKNTELCRQACGTNKSAKDSMESMNRQVYGNVLFETVSREVMLSTGIDELCVCFNSNLVALSEICLLPQRVTTVPDNLVNYNDQVVQWRLPLWWDYLFTMVRRWF